MRVPSGARRYVQFLRSGQPPAVLSAYLPRQMKQAPPDSGWRRHNSAMHQTVHFADVFRQCTCSSTQVQKYQKRISGPLLDRIDIQIEVPRLSEDELLQSRPGESSRDIRSRVKRARDAQAERFKYPVPEAHITSDSDQPPHPADAAADAILRLKKHRPLYCNAQMGPKELRAYCKPSDEVKGLLRAAIQQLGLSARAYDRLLKVSRTIADLEGTKDIQVAHVAEAIQYRSLDRKFWGN